MPGLTRTVTVATKKRADEAAAKAKTLPTSARGIRTRASLVRAARAVFERDGWFDARIVDISQLAGVASGSFYTYFDSKEAIFAAVVEELQEEMLHPHVRVRSGVDDPRELISLANREYLESYRRNAKLMAVFDQVAQFDPHFRELRLQRSVAFTERNAKLISALQAQGIADPELDAYVATLGLSHMVSRLAYSVYVQHQEVPFDRLLNTINRLWYNALQLPSAGDTKAGPTSPDASRASVRSSE